MFKENIREGEIMKTIKIAMVVLLLLGSVPLMATVQASPQGVELRESDATSETWYFSQARPNYVLRFIFYASDATQLKISLANVGAEGYKWRATAYVYGKTPQKKIITASGKAGVFSAPATLKTGGLSPLYAYVEIRFLSGPTPWTSGTGQIKFESDGTAAFTHISGYPLYSEY